MGVFWLELCECDLEWVSDTSATDVTRSSRSPSGCRFLSPRYEPDNIGLVPHGSAGASGLPYPFCSLGCRGARGSRQDTMALDMAGWTSGRCCNAPSHSSLAHSHPSDV